MNNADILLQCENGMLAMFVLGRILMANVGIQSIMKSHQRFTDCFGGANHRLQDRDWNSPYHSSDRTLILCQPGALSKNVHSLRFQTYRTPP